MSVGIVHVVGAGLAGLAAACAVSAGGGKARLYEAAPQAGGRCRSFHDPHLDRVIDSGSHLLLAINRNALGYIGHIGGLSALSALPPKVNFADLRDGGIWQLGPGRLSVGWAETLRALGLPWLPAAATVAGRLGHCPGYERLWHPLTLAILNTPAERASARLFARVLRAVLLGGTKGMQGYAFPHGLSAALVDPALAYLRRNGAVISFHQRLTGLCQSKLTFGEHTVSLAPDDRVILALPPWALVAFLPECGHFPSETITNIHYRLPRLPPCRPPLGLIGGQAQWLFIRGDVASVTLSAATTVPDPHHIWAEIAPLLNMPGDTPPFRVVWEKRATLSHDPQTIARRPGPVSPVKGVFLAGDWLASPWPCTMESAISSGLAAARLALGRDDLRW